MADPLALRMRAGSTPTWPNVPGPAQQGQRHLRRRQQAHAWIVWHLAGEYVMADGVDVEQCNRHVQRFVMAFECIESFTYRSLDDWASPELARQAKKIGVTRRLALLSQLVQAMPLPDLHRTQLISGIAEATMMSEQRTRLARHPIVVYYGLDGIAEPVPDSLPAIAPDLTWSAADADMLRALPGYCEAVCEQLVTVAASVCTLAGGYTSRRRHLVMAAADTAP